MEIISKRDRIRSVKIQYDRQYGGKPDGWLLSDGTSPKEKSAALALLNLEVCAEEAVNEIIGNDSWTALKCDECEDDCDFLISLGESPGQGERWANVCHACLMNALEMMDNVLLSSLAES